MGGNPQNPQTPLLSNTTNSSPSNETTVDDKLDKLMKELAIAQTDKACVEDNMTDEKCKEIKTKMVRDTDMERLEFIGNLNKKCRDFGYTDEQCKKYKETFIRQFRDDIEAEKPFSDLDPRLKAFIEEGEKKMCGNGSEEKCKNRRLEMLRLVQQQYREFKKIVADGCEKRNVPADKCKEIETRELEDFNKHIVSLLSKDYLK